MQNVRTMQGPTKNKGEKIYQQELDLGDLWVWLELGATEPVGSPQILAAADQRVAVDFFVDTRSIVTKADKARFAVKWLAFRAMPANTVVTAREQLDDAMSITINGSWGRTDIQPNKFWETKFRASTGKNFKTRM